MLLPGAQRHGQPRYGLPPLATRWTHTLFSGILARSGRGIKFTDLTYQIRTTYNFSPSFCSFVPHFAARMLNRNYNGDTFDLHELDLHNGIEHDGSLTRTSHRTAVTHATVDTTA